jgi:hypothetical protein
VLRRVLRRWWATLKGRFVGVTRSEKWGYVVWGAMGVVIAVPELSAVGKGCDFPWPTISTTVGHLQELWPAVAIVPVALIVIGAYFTFTLMPSSPPLIADDDHLVVRTPEGRRTKVAFTSYDQLLSPSAGAEWSAQQPSRKALPVLPYLGVATLAVLAGWVVALGIDDRFATGYIGYSIIAIFWVILPSALAYWFKRDIQFTTLTYTVGMLGRRLPIVAALTAALLVILLLHLALYPWPSTSVGDICSATP